MALGDGNDVVNTVPTSRVIADGGPDIDTLNFNAGNQPIQTTPNTISVGGVLLVNHVNFETVANQNTLGGSPTLTINSPTTDPAITSTTPFISLAGTAADDGQYTVGDVGRTIAAAAARRRARRPGRRRTSRCRRAQRHHGVGDTTRRATPAATR